MPALSPTMSQGNVNSWEVKEGDEVSAGSILATLETDKATLEWENQVRNRQIRAMQKANQALCNS